MSNRIAIVTGASRGIGKATAIRLAKDYDGIVLVARSAELLEETAKEIEGLSAVRSEPATQRARVRLQLDEIWRKLSQIQLSPPEAQTAAATPPQAAAPPRAR